MDIFGLKKARLGVLKLVRNNKNRWYGFSGSFMENRVVNKLVKEGFIVKMGGQFKFNAHFKIYRVRVAHNFHHELNQF